jgi:hypothetical protein
MKKFLILISLIAILFLVTTGYAESYSGSLDAPATGVYNDYVGPYTGYPANGSWHTINVGNIENSLGMKYLIQYDTGVLCRKGFVNTSPTDTYYLGNNVSGQTDFTAKAGITTIGSGVLGFQRLFNWLGVEQYGYSYLIFNSWNPGFRSGTHKINLTFDDNALHGLYAGDYGVGGSLPVAGYIQVGSASGVCGNFSIAAIYPFHNSYMVVEPEGLGITGDVFKNDSGTAYSSRVHIINGLTNQTLSSDATNNTQDFHFNMLTIPNVVLAVVDTKGHWYNVSMNFANATPPTTPPTTTTVSPTPTAYPTVTPGNETPPPLPAGYARTAVFVRNSQTGGLIKGVNINLKDNINNSWHNSSYDQDGYSWIDTLPNDNIAMDLNYPGVYYGFIADGLPTPTKAGEEIVYNEILYPVVPLSPEFVDFEVRVADKNTLTFLNGAQVMITYGTTIYGGATSDGSALFTVPNNTAMTITASKTGYEKGTVSVNSGPTIYNTTIIYLWPITTPVTTAPTGVIPTKTVVTTVTGNTTPIPTVSPREYTGFWGPIAQLLDAMGAQPTEIGILLAALLVFVGFVVGGWASAPFTTSPSFSPQASVTGGIFGFVLSCAFGFIPLVWVVAIIFIGIFAFVFFK